MVLPIAGPAAAGGYGISKRKKSRYTSRPNEAVIDYLAGGGAPSGIANEFLGSLPQGTHQRAIKEWFEDMGPVLAQSLFNSKGYQYLQNPNHWDDSMGAYGAGAGIMGQQARSAQSQGSAQLGRMGLGRSGAQAALAGQTQQALGGQQANLFSSLYQQSIANRLTGASRAFDLDRSIMSLALGLPYTQSVQVNQDPNYGGAIAGGLGSALGGIIGSIAAPGPGTAAGAAAGGAAGGGAFNSFFTPMG